MTLIISSGRLLNLDKPTFSPVHAGGQVLLYEGLSQQYEHIYRTQSSVRTVVDFLARNIAQLNLKMYRRLDNTERQELSEHSASLLIKRPNDFTTRYRFIRDLVSDLAIYDNAFIVKMKSPNGSQMNLVRVPPTSVWIDPSSWLYPSGYIISGTNGQMAVTPDQMLHFRGYNPTDGRTGLSPLETLRRILSEEDAASRHREGYYRNSARIEGLIQRPIEAPMWSPEARERFREGWEALTRGSNNAGRTAILEEGMTFAPISFSPKDSEFIASRKLSREEVARAYHIPLPMVGILDNATFSNIQEQHRNLYQDTLGPWLSMLEEELELQLLPEFADATNCYFEFNLAEKLKGSFEESAAVISQATGAPWLSVNEARARQNLPRIDDPLYDVPVQPLNMTFGGGAALPSEPSPAESNPSGQMAMKAADVPARFQERRARYVTEQEAALTRFFDRQAQVIQSRLGGKSKASLAEVFDERRWNKELSADLFKLALALTTEEGTYQASKFGATYDVNRTLGWLEKSTAVAASNINYATRTQLRNRLSDPDYVKQVFETAKTSRAAQIALSRVQNSMNFAKNEGSKQGGATKKTWVVTSPNSRHPELDGETVKLDDTFSNGLLWPGDASAGDPDEAAHCECLLDIR